LVIVHKAAATWLTVWLAFEQAGVIELKSVIEMNQFWSYLRMNKCNASVMFSPYGVSKACICCYCWLARHGSKREL